MLPAAIWPLMVWRNLTHVLANLQVLEEAFPAQPELSSRVAMCSKSAQALLCRASSLIGALPICQLVGGHGGLAQGDGGLFQP